MSSVTTTPGTTLRLRYRDSSGTDRDIPFPLPIQQRPYHRDINTSGTILFVEEFRELGPVGVENDGVGVSYRDSSIIFQGHPTLCLDPLSSITTAADPGTVPDSNGVIAKRRFANLVAGKFGLEAWLFFSSNGLTVNNNKSISLYNRDGTNITIGRIWFDTPTSTSVDLRRLQSDGTYTLMQNYAGSWDAHQWDPSIDSYSNAGVWNYCKLVVDFDAKKYVSFQWNELFIDLSTFALRVEANTAAKALHFSFEMGNKSTGARRYMHVGHVVGTKE